MGDPAHTRLVSEQHRGQQRALLKVQLGRSFVYTLLVGVAALSKLLDQLSLSWWVLVATLVLANASAAVMVVLARRAASERDITALQLGWMVLDGVVLVALVLATGGSGSLWYPWALANVAGVATVFGRRGALVSMCALALACLAAVIVVEGPTVERVSQVLVRLLVVYAGGLVAVQAVCQLRTKLAELLRIQQNQQQQETEVELLNQTLDQRSQQVSRLNEELRKAAVTDPVTGLLNRQFLQQRMEEDIALMRRLWTQGEELPADSYLGFVVIDVDGCHLLNEKLGREAGDEALRALAVKLDEEVRAMDTLVRWQSDEFVIVLRRVEVDDLPNVVGRFFGRARGELSLMADGQRLMITVSAGYCHFPLGDMSRLDWETALGIASQAMQLAKQEGGNCCVGVCAGSVPLDRVGARLLKQDLRAAEDRGYVRFLR